MLGSFLIFWMRMWAVSMGYSGPSYNETAPTLCDAPSSAILCRQDDVDLGLNRDRGADVRVRLGGRPGCGGAHAGDPQEPRWVEFCRGAAKEQPVSLTGTGTTDCRSDLPPRCVPTVRPALARPHCPRAPAALRAHQGAEPRLAPQRSGLGRLRGRPLPTARHAGGGAERWAAAQAERRGGTAGRVVSRLSRCVCAHLPPHPHPIGSPVPSLHLN